MRGEKKEVKHYSILFSDKTWICCPINVEYCTFLQLLSNKNPGGIIKPDNSLIFSKIFIKYNLEGIKFLLFALPIHSNKP